MAVIETVPMDKEKTAIDMTVSMIAEDLADRLHITVEEAFTAFLQSRTCATLYDNASKLWWDGPAYITDLYLSEIGKQEVLL